MNNIWYKITIYLYLNLFSKILLGVSVVFNLILWYIWHYQTPFNQTLMYFSFGVLVINAALSFIFSRKDQLISYILLSTALLVQIFTLIFIKYSAQPL